MSELSGKDWMSIYVEDAPDLTPKDRAWVGYWDPVFYCEWFLGGDEGLIPGKMPWVHLGLLALLTGKTEFLLKYPESLNKILSNFVWLDEAKVEHRLFERSDDGGIILNRRKYVALMLPRGCAKTTIAGIAVPSYEIAYQEQKFMAYVSESGPHAARQLEAIKDIISTNERFRESFGHLRPKMSDDERWAQHFFETKTGVAMLAQGRGGQVRGVLHKGHRPGKILVDDVEDKESVSTAEGRKKAREWFFADVKPALPKVRGRGEIDFLGTMLHPNAILNSLRNDPEWAFVEFGAYDRQGELLWPEWMNDDDVERERRSYQLQGLLHIYYMEYFSEHRTPEQQAFVQEYFQYGIPDPIEDMRKAIYLDPAVSEKRKADNSWIIVIGMGPTGRITVLEVWYKRGATPQELVTQYFKMAKHWRPDPVSGHGFEAQAYQAALKHLFTEYMHREGYYFQVVPITHARRTNGPPTKKEERIQLILQPRYASRYIWHSHGMPVLEGELLDFPYGKHDDGPDCLAGCVALLDPFAANAAMENPAEDTMPPLEEFLGPNCGRWA